MAAGQSPLAQFEIKTLVPMYPAGIDVSFTNSSTFMVLTVITVSAFLLLGMRKSQLVPGRWQSMVELSYVFIANLVRDTVGPDGRPYFPFIFTIFMFVLFGNMWGMIPYSFTFTSHIAVTGILALFVFISVTILGFVKNGATNEKAITISGSDVYNAGTIVNSIGAATHATDGDIEITTVSASGYVVIEVVKDNFNYS